MGYVNSLEGKPTKQRKETSSQGQGFRNHVHFSAFAPGDKRVPWKLRKRFETGEIPNKKNKKKQTEISGISFWSDMLKQWWDGFVMFCGS